MIYLKTEEEVELLRQSNLLVGKTLAEIAKYIEPGVTTIRLDQIAEEFIRDNGAIPTFKGFPNPYGLPFPGSICTSVNDVVVHGIPDDTVLKDEALYLGIEQAVCGKRIGDIGYAVEAHCAQHSYGVVREFVGHGIGKNMHEEPAVPNYGRRGTGIMLKRGMCIAIEPMITLGSRKIYMDKDRWTIRTADGKPAAHFEHTVAVGMAKADILSSFDYLEEVLNIN